MAEIAPSSGPLAGPEVPPGVGADPGAPVAQSQPSQHEVYCAGFWRTFMFCITFLVLLPFFASLPMMISARASAGLLWQHWGILVIAAVFAVVMFLILIEVIYSIRTRVDLGEEKVRLRLPAGRGPTPMLRYRFYEFPYSDVHSVETRREVYGSWLAPVLMKGARVTLKDGTVVPLGYVNEANVDPALPTLDIAARIAERARLPLIDRGNVRRAVHRKLLGLKAEGTASDIVDEPELERLNTQHSTFMLGLIGVFLVLMAIGIVDDLSTEERLAPEPASPVATTPAKPAVKTPPPPPQKRP